LVSDSTTLVFDVTDTTSPADRRVLAQHVVNAGTVSWGGSWQSLYPAGYTWWPDIHHHHHYSSLGVHTHAGPPEKPHETVQRATEEIAQAARELLRSAEQLGLAIDKKDLEEAIVDKVRRCL
jgi:hypothetical protein